MSTKQNTEVSEDSISLNQTTDKSLKAFKVNPKNISEVFEELKTLFPDEGNDKWYHGIAGEYISRGALLICMERRARSGHWCLRLQRIAEEDDVVMSVPYDKVRFLYPFMKTALELRGTTTV